MEIKEYYNNLSDFVSNFLIIDDKKIKLYLVSPFKKKIKSSFSLIINGTNFYRVSGFLACILYEFIKELDKYTIHNMKTINEIANNISDRVLEAYPLELVDNVKSNLFKMVEEIKKISNHEKTNGLFNNVYPLAYSMHYRRIYKLRIPYIEGLELMNKNFFTVIDLEYENEYVNDMVFLDLLNSNSKYYQILDVKNIIPDNKKIQELVNSKLDMINVYIDEVDRNSLPKKSIINLIKTCKQYNLRVLASIYIKSKYIDYMDLIKFLHTNGVYSYNIYVDKELEGNDVLFKRLYFYLNIYHLDVSLFTNGIIKEREIKKMNLNAAYKEDFVTSYYLGLDDRLYFDRQNLVLVGSFRLPLENTFMSGAAKKERKKRRLRVV